MLKFTRLIPAFLLITQPLYALDMGRQGMVFDIHEEDMRAIIARDLQGIDKKAIEGEIRKSIDNYAQRKFKPMELGVAEDNAIRYHNPSMVLNQDIVGMRRNDKGDYEWSVLWPKGTVVNALRSQKIRQWLFYFDARSNKQLQLARDLQKRYPLQIRLILTAGNPIELSKNINNPTFFATAAEKDRFDIRNTPTLVRNGKGEHEFELELVELNPAAENTWQFIASYLDQDALPAINVTTGKKP